MSALNIIIKHKLWKVLNEHTVSLETSLKNYVYWSSKTQIIEENKDFFDNDVLIDFFKTLIRTSYHSREKNIFDYLLKKLSKNDIEKIFTEINNEYILLNWIERNKESKFPNFKMLEFITEDILKNGMFLYLALKSNNDEIFKFAIKTTDSYMYEMNLDLKKESSFKINLLEFECAEKYKIKLLQKFQKEINYEFILRILKKSLSYNQENVCDFIIENYIPKENSNIIKLVDIKYNETVDKFINKYPRLVDMSQFKSSFFKSALKYTENNILKYNIIIERMKKWNLIDYQELFNYFKENLNKDNQQLCILILDEYKKEFESLNNKLFNLNKYKYNQSLIYFVENYPHLFLKNTYDYQDFIKDNILEMNENKFNISNFLDKILTWKIKLDEDKSICILVDIVTKNNIDLLINSPVFVFTKTKLLSKVWEVNLEIAKDLITKMEKDEVSTFWNSLPEFKQKPFSIIYLETVLPNSKKEKRLKI